jgi:hypothetical protein
MDYRAKKALSFEEFQNKLKEPKEGVKKIYLFQFILSFLTSFFLALVMKGGYGFIYDKYLYIFIALIWVSFTVPAIGSYILWSEAPKKIALKKFLSDIIYNLITFVFIIFTFTIIL